MKITDEVVDRVAALAKLRFEGEARERIKQDLDQILSFCEQLQSVDTTGVEPLAHMTDAVNVWREDRPADTVSHEDALKNAPDKNSDYFKVTRFLGKEGESAENDG
jgi:aspartyl-tRNA(Asn)/glutamyl-tRNA(Gln) amidotransferase subunit C